MRRSVLALGAVLAAVAVSVVLLITGGADTHSVQDPAGDVTFTEGEGAPRDDALADIVKASVRRVGDGLVFEVEMNDAVPNKLAKQAMGWRWEVYEGGQMTWLLSANVDLGPNVSVVATQTNYSASTVDDTLPGSISVDGSNITVELDASGIEGFPLEFDWLLKTMLDGNRSEATSALAEDRAPDAGYLKVGE